MGYFRAVAVVDSPEERAEITGEVHGFKPIDGGLTATFDHQFRLGDRGPSIEDEFERISGYVAEVLEEDELSVVVYVDRTTEYGHGRVYRRTQTGMESLDEFRSEEGEGPEPVEDSIRGQYDIDAFIIQ